MTLQAFIENKRLSSQRDTDGTTIIPGKNGHIFDYGGDCLGVTIMPQARHSRTWNRAHVSFVIVGMTITQDGDSQGIATFDPACREQSKVALKHAGISARREATPAQLAALAGHRAAKHQQNQLDHGEGPPMTQQSFLAAQTTPLSGDFSGSQHPPNPHNTRQTENTSKIGSVFQKQ